MKPQYATNPDGEPVVLITPPQIPYTQDEIKGQIATLQAKNDDADGAIAELTKQVNALNNEKTARLTEIADLQVTLDGFPIDVQPIDPQPLPVTKVVI